MEEFDLIILGGGAAGLAAALYNVDPDRRVAVVDPGPLGGTGFHQGPEPFLWALDHRTIPAKPPTWSELKQAAQEWAGVVGSRWEKQLEEAGVRWIRGRGVIEGSHRVDVQTASEVLSLKTQAVVLATGSHDRPHPVIPFDDTHLLAGDCLAGRETLPESILILGGNSTAMEWAYVLRQVGIKVFLCDEAEGLLTGQDPDLMQYAEGWMKANKVKMLFRKRIQSIFKSGDEVRVTLDGGVQFTVNQMVFCGPRQVDVKPLTRGGPFPDCGADGEILVNEKMETTVKGIYGGGSATGHLRSAFRSQEEGRVAAANALGKKRTYHSQLVPIMVGVQPPVGAVGCFQGEAHHLGFRGVEGRGGVLPDSDSGSGDRRGLWCKLVVDRQSREVIGGQGIGPGTPEVLALIQTAMRKGLTARDLAQISAIEGTPVAVLTEAARHCVRLLAQRP